MKKARKSLMAFMILVGTCVAPMAALQSMGQELTDESGQTVEANANAAPKSGGGFYDIVFGSGVVGFLLWAGLFADGAFAIYFSIDCMILIKAEKLMPQRLIDQVQKAMSEGDIVAALEACHNTPSCMSNILTSAFQHVEEGFEVIQEAVTAASDLEQEKLMQRLTWIAVCGNLGPALGLLGTVQGMILCFQALAAGGAGDPASLANSIGQALWTTAAGLCVSIPAQAIFYSLRNNANRLILRMSAVTMEFLNGLRNVEIAAEGEAAPEALA